MSAAGLTSGALDLEKELSCSICTDVLYQPLTLLDCLHTFCGSCLKEWFSWQATAAIEQRNPHPYTCPSCRASVRAARPNANVTTLLEMYLQANPGKGKSEQEKEEMRRQYKPGDDVLPPVVIAERPDDDSEDERLLEQVRELSVADLDPAVAANRRAERDTRQRRAREGHSPRDQEIRRRENAEAARRRQNVVERNVSHQPSLRSLLSASGEDSAEIQEEILTSILSSGMLDGIDIDHMTAEQEEELTERIAEAYRRRHRDIQRTRREASRTSDDRTQQTEGAQSTEEQTSSRSRPAVPRTHLIEQWMQESPRSDQRAPSSSSQTRRDSPTVRPAAASGLTASPPRAATDTSDRNVQSVSNDSRMRVSAEQRSNTDPQQPGSWSRPNTARSGHHSTPRRSTDSHRDVQRSMVPDQHRSSSNPANATQIAAYPVSDSTATSPPHPPLQHRSEDIQPALQPAVAIPQVNCNRCERPAIQHKLHYHCDKCFGGHFDLCLQCYRAGAGCNNWWGFGYAAQARFESNAPEGGWPADYERPHVLAARRYQRYDELDFRTQTLSTWKPLQEGAFCERCFRYANDSYWHCVSCMEGAWGFCGTCVQQGKHCTHPLLHTALQAEKSPTDISVSLPHIKSDSIIFVPPSWRCNSCHQDIPRHDNYLHCSSCDNGDYDMCTRCHQSLIAAGKITGPPEARRCQQGHSMSLVHFQPTTSGIEQRIVLADADSHTRSPPSSEGRHLALWSWFPAEGIDDELAFPKYAEICDVKKMNEDYNVGTYAGDIGLFPSNHVRPI